MDIRITFRDSPIEAEIRADEDEEYVEVLEQLADFAGEHEVSGQSTNQSEVRTDSVEDEQSADDGSSQEVRSSKDHSNSTFSNVSATDSELQHVIKLGKSNDEDVEKFPQIIGETDLLGDDEPLRLLHASAVILTTLDDAHGISRVNTGDLKDAVGDSGLSLEGWDNQKRIDERDVYFNRTGSGPSARTEIRDPGKEKAYELIELLVEDLRTTGED